MVATADVLVENFRPGVMDRLGLGYDALRTVNPRLVYASITAFGRTGPMANDPAMDLIVQATSGLMDLTGLPGGPPTKSAGATADITAGIYAAYGIAVALLHRERTGVGQRVDVTMLESILSVIADIATVFLNTGRRFEKFGNGHPDLVPYEAFEAADGHFIVACLVNAFCKRLMGALGRAEVLEDPRFATNAARCRHRAEFNAILTAIFRTNTCAHWIALCRAHDVPACRVNSLDDVFALEQMRAIEAVVDWEDAAGRPFKALNLIPRLSASPGALRVPPARLGAHTTEVLRALGKSDADIAALRAAGACG
jgi:crotonobetainyl-CoA:carnitine CoA-transferase CaiB-like acyl-CoA transferase